MNNGRIDIEYPLAATSPNIIWTLISTPHGLERWLADHVEEEDGIYTFTWGEPWTEQDVRNAQLLEYVKHKYIKLKWEDDDSEDTYMEMRIEQSELTGQLNLIITDFAGLEDEDDLRELWTGNLERLHRTSGL